MNKSTLGYKFLISIWILLIILNTFNLISISWILILSPILIFMGICIFLVLLYLAMIIVLVIKK